jgi:hypothetical protein
MFDEIGEDFWSGGGVTAKKLPRSSVRSANAPSRCRSTRSAATCSKDRDLQRAREHPQPIAVK